MAEHCHRSHAKDELFALQISLPSAVTVVASVRITHPKLANWPDVRVVESIEALKRDRHYKVIEKCSPQEFEPSLIVFDQLVDSLEMR
jgi:hypothetical protein